MKILLFIFVLLFNNVYAEVSGDTKKDVKKSSSKSKKRSLLYTGKALSFNAYGNGIGAVTDSSSVGLSDLKDIDQNSTIDPNKVLRNSYGAYVRSDLHFKVPNIPLSRLGMAFDYKYLVQNGLVEKGDTLTRNVFDMTGFYQFGIKAIYLRAGYTYRIQHSELDAPSGNISYANFLNERAYNSSMIYLSVGGRIGEGFGYYVVYKQTIKAESELDIEVTELDVGLQARMFSIVNFNIGYLYSNEKNKSSNDPEYTTNNLYAGIGLTFN